MAKLLSEVVNETDPSHCPADAANNLAVPALVAHTDFYNSTLDHLDLMAEYYAWQNPSSHAG